MNTILHSTPSDQALIVKNLLNFAANNHDFWLAIYEKGTETFANFPISYDAKAAITSGDVQWIRNNIGEISVKQIEVLNSYNATIADL